MPGRGMIATIGGLPAASRERTTGRKSRADSYFVLIPVLAVNAVRTFWKASCSPPPQSDSTLTVPVPASLPLVVTTTARGGSDCKREREDERTERQRVLPDHVPSSVVLS